MAFLKIKWTESKWLLIDAVYVGLQAACLLAEIQCDETASD